MELTKLTKEQIEYVYENSMVKDFPEKERKPLKMILKAFEEGSMECLGLFTENEITGYAFFVKMGNRYLFDYLAIFEKARNSGIGSGLLDLISEYFKDADSVIGEVENPEYAKNEADRELMQRRKEFYFRNNYIDTGVKCWLFGVHYNIIELNMGKNHTADDIKRLYLEHYRNMLPKIVYKTMVRIEE